MRTLYLLPINDPQPEPLVDALSPFKVGTLLADGGDPLQPLAAKLGAALGCDVEADDHLAEVRPSARTSDAVAALFAAPADAPAGEESAYEGRGRLAAALFELFDEVPNGNLAVLTGCKVAALFVASCSGAEPFQLWQAFSQPGQQSIAALSLPDLRLLDIVTVDTSGA